MVSYTKPQRRLHRLAILAILVSILVGCTQPPPRVIPTEAVVSSPVPTTSVQVVNSPTTSPVSPTITPLPQVTPSGAINVDGESWFLFGANYPWHSYGNDFGENAWGHNGVSIARDQVDADFQEMSEMGVRIARWFVFTDGRAAPDFATDGSVSGLDDKFFRDLDTALEIAQKHNIRLILVLLDFHWLAPQQAQDGVLLGGHADTITNPAKRKTFYQKALLPLLDRYGKNPYILAWEIINEPEWAMSDPDIKTDQQLVRIPPSTMQSFITETADLIHGNADQDVTVGSASRRWWKFWETSALDLCQIHYYPWMEEDTPLDFSSSDVSSKTPCILGEFPTTISNAETDFTLDQYYQILLKNGYAGAFPWSLRAEDTFSNLTRSSTTVEDWAHRLAGHIEIPSPVGWLAPTPLPTRTPTRTQTPMPSPTSVPTKTVTRAAPTAAAVAPTASPPGGDPAMYGFELRDGEWVAQPFEDSRAVTTVARVNSPVYSGKFALQLDVNLIPADASNSKGEAFVDVIAFEPLDHSVGPYDLQNGAITCWMYLPAAAYDVNHSPWIGFQVFVKDSETRSEYSSWRRVQVTHVDRWLSIQLNPRRYPAPDGHMDPGFDPSMIKFIGVKIGVDDYYADPGVSYTGPIYVDSCSWK